MSDTDLRKLLQSWNLSELMPHFQAEGITVDVMQMMKAHHVAELLRHFKLGIRIRFEHHFTLWRRDINKPLQEGVACRGFGSYDSMADNGASQTDAPAGDAKFLYRKSRVTTMNDASVNTSPIYMRSLSTTPPLLQIAERICRSNSPASNSELSNVEHSCQSSHTEMPKLTPVSCLIVQEEPEAEGEDSSARELIAGTSKRTAHITVNNNGFLQTPISVEAILRDSGPRGHSIFEHYIEHGILNSQMRGLIITLIVEFFDQHNLHLPLQMSYKLEDQILKLFPNEKLENYRTEKRGRLYVKFSNSKRYRREKASVQRASKRRHNSDTDESTAKLSETHLVEVSGHESLDDNGQIDNCDDEEWRVDVKPEYLSD